MCSSNDTLKERRASWFPDWTIAWGSRAITIFKIRQFCVYMFAPFYTSFLNCGKSLKGLPRWRNSKESDCQCRRRRRWGLIPGLRRSPGGGNGNPLQSSCLGNPMDRGGLYPWWATVCGVAKSQTGLSNWTHQTHPRHYKSLSFSVLNFKILRKIIPRNLIRESEAIY